MTVDQLAAGKDLWLMSSDTAPGPFLSILQDPAVWQNYQRLIVAHNVRHSSELVWQDEIADIRKRESLAEANATLTYLSVVTRELRQSLATRCFATNRRGVPIGQDPPFGNCASDPSWRT